MNIINHPWALFFFCGYVAFTTIRGVYFRRANRLKSVHRQVDGLEKALLLVAIPAGTFLPLVYLFTPLLSFADYRLPSVIPWCGAVIMLVAIWFLWRSHADLGDNWSISLIVRKDHKLVTHGVYHFIRHPMYASIFLWGVAQALLLPNWLAGWSTLVPFTVLYFVRTPREEQMMLEFFGDQYHEYMGRTGRLIPRLWQR